METRRWTNPSQPQTLYIAVMLLYINAGLSLIFGSAVGILFGWIGVLALIVGSVAAGLGIANEKKWGYVMGVAVAVLNLAPYLIVLAGDLGAIFSIRLMISLIFPVALFALLVHPMSREYQRIWFR